MEKLPGVAAAYPDAHVKGIKIRYRGKETTAIGLAMPREAALLGVADEILVAGRLFEEGDQPEAILGVQLANNLGFKTPQEAIGAQITVEAAGLTPEGGNEFSFHRKVLTVTIVGVYRAPPLMPGSAQQGIFLPVELMKEIPGMYLESALNQLKAGGSPAAAGYASVTVRVRDPAYLDDVEKEIRGMGYHTQAILGKLQDMRRFFLAIQLLLTVVGSIALAIAALGIVNTLLMAVLERYQEIGLCKAIGASDGDLFVLFLTEAGIIGFLGGLTGHCPGLADVVGHGGRGHGLCPPARHYRPLGSLCLSRSGCWPSPSPSPSSSAWWPASIPPCGPRGSIRSAPCDRIDDGRTSGQAASSIRRTACKAGTASASR